MAGLKEPWLREPTRVYAERIWRDFWFIAGRNIRNAYTPNSPYGIAMMVLVLLGKETLYNAVDELEFYASQSNAHKHIV